MNKALIFSVLVVVLGSCSNPGEIKEEQVEIPTYPFSDPNPIPILTTKPEIYPYHRFEGYSHESEPKEWKVITLENEYLEVTILPEVGGKVWGAIEKSTGKDFIYKNRVMKFRNIAMRGPWTSGGIEFNFGIIGHTPSTATPVDYTTFVDPDGTQNCVVGMIDLPSRTQWRVKISLPPDAAYFETEATWYNPTSHSHPYYNWMTAAAKTTDDLVFYYPGNISLQHSGDLTEWPVNKDGKEIWWYKENDFGPSKSYHVTGVYHNFFGGYWHNEDIGFVHAGRHETMPGQKLWLWSLARNGGIWEDLLTDDNGQYMEFQAGRLFNQYFNDNYSNPVTEVAFAPHLTDQWTERWHPAKGTAGITAVHQDMVINIIKNEENQEIRINALKPINGNLIISVDGRLTHEESLNLEPMDLYSQSVNQGTVLRLMFDDKVIYDSNEEEAKKLKRILTSDAVSKIPENKKQSLQARELLNKRKYYLAKQLAETAIQEDNFNYDAYKILSQIHLKNGLFDSALFAINHVLSVDTYDFDGNYFAGLAYKGLGDRFNTLDAFGLASRSMKYRSAAYTEMAELHAANQNYENAIEDASYALEFNTKNISALQILAVSQRIAEHENDARNTRIRLLEIDPLNHFARFENYLDGQISQSEFTEGISNELSYQSYLEIASFYDRLNLSQNAIDILAIAPSHPMVSLWHAYFRNQLNLYFVDQMDAFVNAPTAFVFPYRQETEKILHWAEKLVPPWKMNYYLALYYWNKNQYDKAQKYLEMIGDEADEPAVYVARAKFLHQTQGKNQEVDLTKALELEPTSWRFHHELIKYLGTQAKFDSQLDRASKAFEIFPEHYVIGLDYAQSLLNNEMYDDCLGVLRDIQVLPSEGSFSGRKIYGEASLRNAYKHFMAQDYAKTIENLELSYFYPENLGSGKPFDPEERMLDYFMSMAIQSGAKQTEVLNKIVSRTSTIQRDNNISLRIFYLHALKDLGERAEINAELTRLQSFPDSPGAQAVLNHWNQKTPPIDLIRELIF